jgi:tetratricopeptide (TPR) repeat protein/HEAT repeat protein
VRRIVLVGWLALAAPALGLITEPAHAADFDPRGRTRKPKPKPGGTATPRAPRPSGTPTPRAPKPAAAGPSSEVLIARYTAIVLEQPSAPFPLQRLAQLYRERDGNLKKLIEAFEQRAATDADAWPAKVALAGLYKLEGRADDAIKTYEAAILERPKEPSAVLALARLEGDRGDKAGARRRYEQALALLKAPADVEQTRRTLLGLCLDLKDFDAAKEHHAALVRAGQGSLFVKGELGRELFARGEYERAEAEYRELVRAAAGDNRALAPALRDLGQALAKQKKTSEALVVLKRARAVAGSSAGVGAEVLLIMTDAFRAEGRLGELIEILEAERGQDFQRLTTLGGLYEETGAVDKALTTYRRALAIDGRHIDTRLRLVHLLQTAGALDEAIREYEALIKAAPNNPDFVFELCETLIQRGDRPKALGLVEALERRTKDAEVLARVADFYERVEEKDRALKLLQRLAQTQAGDPTYLVDLGDRYYQAGDKKKALETWARLRAMIPNRAKAAATLGEVYLDHDMPTEALTALREAVTLDPSSARYKKSLAIALERTASATSAPAAQYGEALELWQELLRDAQGDKLVLREARAHIVSLWSLRRELPRQVAPLRQRFAAAPPDLEAGRLLAEVQRKLQRLGDAEATLRKVVLLAPGDEESLLLLERVLVQAPNLPAAIEVLEKLASVNPKRAREFYQRMAQYAAELYRDDDAIQYAARAVELSPDDASGHQKLGELYKRRQDVPRAIQEYRRAIAKNDRLFAVYFELAELLLSTGQTDEADKLFRRVVRASPDEELILRAARMSMQVNLGRGSLVSLERELLPLAVGNPQRPVYRRLLVEVYGAMTFPLVQEARSGAPSAMASARAELARIGARAVKPLLDALTDDKESQQKVALVVLSFVENKGAGPALYAYATGQADKDLRVRAMLACGALRDPALLPKYEALLTPKAGALTLPPSDALAVAAAWGVARMGDARAEPLLVRLLSSTAPEVRAFAAMGLGLSHDRRHAPLLASLAGSPEAGPTARAAAVHGLAELGPGAVSAASASELVELARANEPLLRRAALLALGRLGSTSDARGNNTLAALAEAVFSASPEVRAAAMSAAGELTAGGRPPAAEWLPVPDGALSARDVLDQLAARHPASTERTKALVMLAPALEQAAVAAVVTSPERAQVVATALLGREDRLTLAPFTDQAAVEPAPDEGAKAAIERVAAAVVPGFVALVGHPSAEVRAQAIALLARRAEPEAQEAVVAALDDPDEAVRRAALSAVGTVAAPATVRAIARVSRDAPSWSSRVRAVEALGRLGRRGASPLIVEALAASARRDPYALVREAAMRALAPLDASASRAVFAELERRDPEPRIRQAARELLEATPPSR